MRSDDKNLVLSKRMEKSGLQQDYISSELDVIFCSHTKLLNLAFVDMAKDVCSVFQIQFLVVHLITDHVSVCLF